MAESEVWCAREKLASLVKAQSPDQVSFSLNATMSLNAVANHLGKLGGRVLTSGLEHNSVTRPLYALEQAGAISYEVIPTAVDGPVDLDWLRRELCVGDVVGVVTTWVSNVSGEVTPVEQISEICRQREVFLAVDAAQALGYMPIDSRLADVLVFAGHKGLGGPQGVGGAVIHQDSNLAPFVRGGSGGRSESPMHPAWLPWSQEAGTLNGVGIAGLGCALDSITDFEIIRRESYISGLRSKLKHALSALDRVKLVEPFGSRTAAGVLSFQVEGALPNHVAEFLEEKFDILVRAGLHCAPLAHETLGTGNVGAVRASISMSTTEADIDTVIYAVSSYLKTQQTRASKGQNEYITA